jgi:hypothetical protein
MMPASVFTPRPEGHPEAPVAGLAQVATTVTLDPAEIDGAVRARLDRAGLRCSGRFRMGFGLGGGLS